MSACLTRWQRVMLAQVLVERTLEVAEQLGEVRHLGPELAHLSPHGSELGCHRCPHPTSALLPA